MVSSLLWASFLNTGAIWNFCVCLQEAVDKYESVIANLEFARELQKLYQGMSDEVNILLLLTKKNIDLLNVN